jgi:uncharacterized membrane protein
MKSIDYMKMAIVLVVFSVLMLLIAGCSSGYGLVKESDVSERTIKWERHDPILCAGLPSMNGCAFTLENPCRIVMREDSPDWLVAEEFRHCFGYVHVH